MVVIVLFFLASSLGGLAPGVATPYATPAAPIYKTLLSFAAMTKACREMCPIATVNLLLAVFGLFRSGLAEMMAKERAEVDKMSNDLAAELNLLTLYTNKPEMKRSFEDAKVVEENWSIVVQDVAEVIRRMMAEKVDVVKKIKEHAELLSMYRKPPLNSYTSYDFYDASSLDNTSDVEDRSDDIKLSERLWRCSIPPNVTAGKHFCFNKKKYGLDDSSEYDSFNYNPPVRNIHWETCAETAFVARPKDYYKSMNMVYDPNFDANVNTNFSIIRITPGVYAKDSKVLNGIRWSEGLDLTFKCNYENDPTLTYQFFASSSGFVRFYPAMQWSDEEYQQTFDFRIRPWFVEGFTSAKDIIILVDRSGSMKGDGRFIATQIVNAILDTLTDNDFVNIYVFNNSTEPLVSCFNDTIVQANEENLRLLRERLVYIKDIYNSSVTLGLQKAFEILWNYREAHRGPIICNQAIMLITEGLDYEISDVLFKQYNHLPNDIKYRPIRVFTYLLSKEKQDAQKMLSMACANMGYYVNITVIEEVREKVLKYMDVMSRPINFSQDEEFEPAWTALYVHLADRRLSNFLWDKYEGNIQRDIFVNYENEDIRENGYIVEANQSYFSLETDHPYQEYLEMPEYTYLTSVSLPVYDKRPQKIREVDEYSLLGVAGVDVPLDYIKKLTQPHRIGVNGYGFIITNNGYVLHHPDHRCEFKNRILKPTFNRVDFTEVEISDNTTEPRKFDEDIIKLREEIVLLKRGSRKLKVRTPLDDMKRVEVSYRHYYYTDIKPFSLVIALPDNYGSLVIRYDKRTVASLKTKQHRDQLSDLLKMNMNWRIHPKWLYTCLTHREHKSPELEWVHFLKRENLTKNCNKANENLIEALLKELDATKWYETQRIKHNRSQLRNGVKLIFMATHTGLTRWRDFIQLDDEDTHFANTHNKAPDEIYYRRAADINYKSDVFVYSVPFQDKNPYNESTTLITASHVIFKGEGNTRAPVCAIGFQLYHKTLHDYWKFIQRNASDNLHCDGVDWTCYVIDNDGYIILDNDTEHVGKSISNVDKNLIDYLVKDGVYKEITVFDYQGTCYPKYIPVKKKEFYGPTYEEALKFDGFQYCKKENITKCKTLKYMQLQLQKTTPTPCDIELKMYVSLNKNYARTRPSTDCDCAYIATHIKGTNLKIVAVQGVCYGDLERNCIVNLNPYPKEITYNLTLPCYIATMNNFTKRNYRQCIIKTPQEFNLNFINDRNCGGEGPEEKKKKKRA